MQILATKLSNNQLGTSAKTINLGYIDHVILTLGVHISYEMSTPG